MLSLLLLMIFYHLLILYILWRGFPDGSMGKNQPPVQETQETQFQSLGWKESPGEGNGEIHSSILAQKNPMDRGTGQAAAQRVTKSPT